MQLSRIDGYLTAGHIGNLHVEEHLHILLGHLHTDVVAGFLQVLRGGFEVQAIQFDGLWQTVAREQGNAGA